MSYIAFDLDALNAAPAVARAAGLREEDVIAGLVRLWAWCFREKTDRATPVQIRGHFGSDAAEALEAFGFLESSEEGYRVRGASRYLRIAEARSKGGQMAKGNLIPGGPKRKPSRGGSRGGSRAPAEGPAEVQPRTPLGSTSALTPSTEHRTPLRSIAPEDPAPPEASGWRQLIADMVAAAPGYAFRPRDARSLKALLALADGDAAEVLARWRRALMHRGYPTVRTTWELETHWAHFGPQPQEVLPVFSETREVEF